MRNLTKYLAERFPLGAVVPLSVVIAMYLIGAATPLQFEYFAVHHVQPALASMTFVNTLLVTLLMMAFLLRTRVTDEFKDNGHDTANYPNRPVQRGLVAKDQLFRVGIVAFAVEVLCVLACGILQTNIASVASYIPVLAFSYLTAKEFFAPKWLERHFTLYFVSHQLMFVCFAFWAYNTFGAATTDRRDLAQVSLWAFVLLMAGVEIVRKYELRYSPNGELVKDTYPSVWGLKASALVLAALLFIAGTLEGYALFSPAPFLLGATAATIVGSSWEKTRLVRATGFLGFAILAVVLWWS